MKFSDYTYQRPDFTSYKTEFLENLSHFTNASSFEDAQVAINQLDHLRGIIDTAMNLAGIRYSIDTNDIFYEKEDEFWNTHAPHFDALNVQFYNALLASPFILQLKEAYPETLFLFAENQVKLFDEQLIPLYQKENQLISDYEKLLASAQIEFNGGTYTLAQLKPFTENKERQVRLDALAQQTAFFVEHESAFDRIYDELVHIRTTIAQKLGFKSYVEYADIKMNRWDYDRPMIEGYRREILTKIVPLTKKLYQRQATRNQQEALTFADLALVYPSGNANPKGSSTELIQKAQHMYHELSKETGLFFDFMLNHELLDLLSKKGKQSGGYCTFIQDYQSPFIFANFNGTSGDIDVLTHEAGHAFQAFESRWIKEPEILFPNYESCEIHSMSMEFIAWPWMESFFKEETEKYKFAHLSGSLQFLPYGVLVDHFQQEVYEHPEWDAAKRKVCWRQLEKQYCPERDYSEFPDLERGIYWYRQGHIFADPFYYIDYTLAQVCAFQFWKRFVVDHDTTAWSDYLAICQVGGTKTFLEILELSHLSSPFKAGALDETIAAVDAYLTSVPEEKLTAQ